MKIRKLIPIIFSLMLIVPVFLLLSADGVASVVPAHTFPVTPRNSWIGSGVDPNASNGANWENGSVLVNKILVFRGDMSINNCNFDYSGTINGFIMTADYIGTISQSANYTINGNMRLMGGLYQSDDISAYPVHAITIIGGAGVRQVIVDGGSFYNLQVNLIIDSDTTFLQSNQTLGYASVIYNLTVTAGNILRYKSGPGILDYGPGAMKTYIEGNARLVLDTTDSMATWPFIWYPGFDDGISNWSWLNLGVVSAIGDYPLIFWAEEPYAHDYTFAPGDINCPIYIYNEYPADKIRCTLIGDAYLSNVTISALMVVDTGPYNFSSASLSMDPTSYFIDLRIGANTTLGSDIWIAGWLYYQNYSHIDLNGYVIHMTMPGNVTYYYPASFTNTPSSSVQTGLRYSYRPVMDQPVTFTIMNNSAGWLIWFNDTVIGIPRPEDVGIYTFGIRAENGIGDMTYLNFSVEVYPNDANVMLILSVLLGFGLIIFATILEIKPLFMLSGIVWIYCGMTVFALFGTFFMVIGIGIGMLLFIHGGMSIGGSRDDKQA